MGRPRRGSRPRLRRACRLAAARPRRPPGPVPPPLGRAAGTRQDRRRSCGGQRRGVVGLRRRVDAVQRRSRPPRRAPSGLRPGATRRRRWRVWSRGHAPRQRCGRPRCAPPSERAVSPRQGAGTVAESARRRRRRRPHRPAAPPPLAPAAPRPISPPSRARPLPRCEPRSRPASGRPARARGPPSMPPAPRRSEGPW